MQYVQSIVCCSEPHCLHMYVTSSLAYAEGTLTAHHLCFVYGTVLACCPAVHAEQMSKLLTERDKVFPDWLPGLCEMHVCYKIWVSLALCDRACSNLGFVSEMCKSSVVHVQVRLPCRQPSPVAETQSS